MNYFIFGGSGFIGSHLITLLSDLKSESRIYNLDLKNNNHKGTSIFIECDVRKIIDINVPVTSDDVIFNLAAVHRTPGSPDYDYFETNILGAENVCTFANKNGIKKILFTSSIAPYGAAEDLKKEETLPTPNSPYGISKLVAEKIHCIWQAKNDNRQLTILRPGVVYGKGENGNFTRLYWSIRKRRFFYPGRKDTIKACIYVKELVRFMVFEIEKKNHIGVELYNCTFEPAFSIEKIVETIKKVTALKKHVFKVNGSFLMFAANIAGPLGGKKIGIHPARVKKLMISTNISGKKLAASEYEFYYSFEDSIIDWYKDNDCRFLK